MSTEKHGKTPDILKPLRLPKSDPTERNSHRHEYHNGTRVAECTEHPLWYLQQRRVIWTDEPSDSYMGSHDEGSEVCLRWVINDQPITDDEMLENECAQEYWETVDVFLDRDEAQAFGEATKHRYTLGFRVYCMPIKRENSLSALLNGVVPLADEYVKHLQAAHDALMSYKHGNASPFLAQNTAEAIAKLPGVK